MKKAKQQLNDSFISKLFENKKAIIGSVIILLFIVMAIIGPILLPYNPTTSFADRYKGMSFEHPLGTDDLGRDILRQLIQGTSSVLIIALFTGIFTVGIGTILGMTSGYLGGPVDKVIQWITNIVLTIPSFPVMLILASLFTITDPITFALTLSVWSWAGLSRAIRAQVMSLKERDFIQICQVMNMSKTHIIFKELFPNIASYILINFIISVKSAIIGSVGVMMLGLAAYEPTNWGAMIEHARSLGLINPKVIAILVPPLVAIIIFQFGAIFLADGLDEVFNPRLKVN
ncbi:ABC transporter permease [Acholeplasma laidlawii]|uniref:ABC transporter permease n=1 Tax=Acholeplasma laidlawii TaxID=2148 RepID=UPI0021F6D952|nr:ABC transporter permease [Acholeplasma laidlawii]